ncbi:trypsin-like isoform X2 [Drosophila hydei]|uniref:Trypsin-like isoform X2 n=1 Tax=Drosophila hydei TaxID=7224 RepID=A0A6J1LL67_DROHY|nr:trypsin-like isoform X2 [Drosophila hydei]
MHLQFVFICSFIAVGLSTYYLPYDQDDSAQPKNHPYAKYVVSIQTKMPKSQYFGTNHLCVGTIVAPIYVLTASHCIFDRKRLMRPDELVIIAGAPNRRKPTEHSRLLHIQSVYPGERESGIKFNTDLALLRLQDQDTLELNLTFNLGIARLATRQSYAQLRCIRLGWGRAQINESFAEVLVSLAMQLQPQKFCHSLYPGIYRKQLLCATGLPDSSQGVCGGDPGGPLFCGSHLTGVYTRDVMCSNRYPAIFVSIASHYDWIQGAFSGAEKALPLLVWLSLRII